MACNGPKSFAQVTRLYFDYTDGAALLQIFHASCDLRGLRDPNIGSKKTYQPNAYGMCLVLRGDCLTKLDDLYL